MPISDVVYTLLTICVKTLVLSVAIGVGIVAVDYANLVIRHGVPFSLSWALLFWGGLIAIVILIMVILQVPLLAVWVLIRPRKVLAPWLDAAVGLVLGVVFTYLAWGEELVTTFENPEWQGATEVAVIVMSTLVGYWVGGAIKASGPKAQ